MVIYFVTGASGFVGRRLCLALRNQGHAVRALVRTALPPDLQAAGVEEVRGDLLDPTAYREALTGSDVVVHLGGLATFGNGSAYRGANLEGTRLLLEEARKLTPDLRRFVFVSTLGAVDRARPDVCDIPLDESSPPHPTTDYGRSKLDAESAVISAGLPWCIVRPTLVAGAGMRRQSHIAVFARQAQKGSLIARFGFPGCMSVIHVDDLVDALATLAVHPDAIGRIFFAAGEAITLASIFDGARPGMTRIGLGWVRPLLRPLAGMLPFRLKAIFFDCLVADDAALRALGWMPSHRAAATVREVAEEQRYIGDASCPPAGWSLVTGAASGLGRAVAETLAATGRRLILVDRDATGMEDTARGGCKVVRIKCDLADPCELECLLARPEWQGDGVSEVFACAGFGMRGMFHQMDIGRQADTVEVNLASRMRLAHHAIRFMLPKHFGRIVFVSSSSAFQPLPYMAAYAATNAALLSFGEAIWGELDDTGIRVLTICPGGMRTSFQRSAGVLELPGEKLLEPEEVARTMLEALNGCSPTAMAGGRVRGMALAARLLPRKATILLWRHLMGKLR
ncbi:MAG: SDR family NAD(P)-dependent oxidoreductase [Candidatus Nitricoxidivorans perseverans]|uniref:SDR family NAD(P)-dependent oxidoreductase n=1 Tax=Candidatus Nitricoxidivorans perseverans TaxID=2975601 RepID=A0AA49FKK7_9PROT|nr:MAG: SDR family NAD(P)-dependent oxidoreductase [Candidatus Nitricoxidivorans perseverans]